MIELVVLDIAGTTVHDGDGVASAFVAALAAVGVHPEPAAVTAVMGIPKPEAIRQLLHQAGTTGKIEEIHADFVRRMIDFYRTAADVREIPGASQAMSRLRAAGVKVALDTGFSRAIVDVILTRLGWHPPALLDATICSDEVPAGRPSPDMIRELMRRFDISDPRKVAKVGDTSSDLESGTNAGCSLVIGVTSGAFTGEQLRRYPHTHIVGSVAEVPDLVLA